MRLSFRLCLLLLLCLPPCTVCAQEDTWGTDVSVEVTKDLSKQAGLELDAELRTRDGVETLDRLEGGLSAHYKLWPWLKLSGGYIFIYDHDERLSHYDEDDRDVKKGLAQVGDPKNLRDYWIVRHRLHADATLTHKWGRWRLSLRERWQYTYRMEKVVKGRYNYLYDRSDQAEHLYRGKGKNVLRSRLAARYKIKKSPFTPEVSLEAFNAWRLEKLRCTAGVYWKAAKGHTLHLYYRYQHGDDDGPRIGAQRLGDAPADRTEERTGGGVAHHLRKPPHGQPEDRHEEERTMSGLSPVARIARPILV